MKSVRRRHLPLARRATAALLVGFWAIAMVGSLFHGSAHEHRYCSQHAKFEEVGAPRAQATPAALPGDSKATSHERAWHAATTTLAFQHESCAFADLGVRAPLDDLPTFDVALPTPPAPVPAPLASHVAHPIPLLANAPKASPPALIV